MKGWNAPSSGEPADASAVDAEASDCGAATPSRSLALPAKAWTGAQPHGGRFSVRGFENEIEHIALDYHIAFVFFV